MKIKEKLKRALQSIKSFALECKRVLILTKKPTNDEFKTIVKVTGLGMIAIGLIGFFVYLIKQVFLK